MDSPQIIEERKRVTEKVTHLGFAKRPLLLMRADGLDFQLVDKAVLSYPTVRMPRSDTAVLQNSILASGSREGRWPKLDGLPSGFENADSRNPSRERQLNQIANKILT